MASEPPNPDFPPQQYTARYELGWATDLEFLGIPEETWDFVYQRVEDFILCKPYHPATWEIAESGGARFLVTTDVPFLDEPPLVVYFKPDETSRRVAFLTAERLPETPDHVEEDPY